MPILKINKARYPKDWAKNRCEWCGAENYKPHPVTGSKVVLTVAHVYDHRPEACSFLNLAALCNKCHLDHDRELHRQTRLKRKQQAIKESGQLSFQKIEEGDGMKD